MAQRPKRKVTEKWIFNWEEDIPDNQPIDALISQLRIIKGMYPEAYAVSDVGYEHCEFGLAIRVEESEEDYQARLEVWAKRERDRIDKQLVKARKRLADLEQGRKTLGE